MAKRNPEPLILFRKSLTLALRFAVPAMAQETRSCTAASGTFDIPATCPFIPCVEAD